MAILTACIRTISYVSIMRWSVAFVFLTVAHLSTASTLRVTNLLDGRDPQSPIPGSLRAALNHAQSGDTVVFSPSLGCGTRRVCTIFVNDRLWVEAKSLTLKGPGSSALVLDGQAQHAVLGVSGGSGDTMFDFNLSGLTIINGKEVSNGGALMLASMYHVSIDDVVFNNNLAEGSGGAISISNVPSIQITNSQFIGNFAGGLGGAIGDASENVDFSNWIVINTRITENWAYSGGGVSLASTTLLTLDDTDYIKGNMCAGEECNLYAAMCDDYICPADIAGGTVIGGGPVAVEQ